MIYFKCRLYIIRKFLCTCYCWSIVRNTALIWISCWVQIVCITLWNINFVALDIYLPVTLCLVAFIAFVFSLSLLFSFFLSIYCTVYEEDQTAFCPSLSSVSFFLFLYISAFLSPFSVCLFVCLHKILLFLSLSHYLSLSLLSVMYNVYTYKREHDSA